LRYFEELTLAEIAERTGISLSNAKVLVMRARKKLSEKIENKP
jgi:RNA polymerase sigma factor (sigma-70 family)